MDKQKLENLEHLRHSCAHLLAAAVMELWPHAKRTIGLAIENGFYYDFEFETPLVEKDLVRIDQKMRELVKSWEGFERREIAKEEALELFKDNKYKKELIEEHAQKGEKLTVYQSGNFIDLCRGGHVENPREALKHFRLMSLSGAYWLGDEKNNMLTRIYGTCFATKEELEKYLWMLEEAKKRDHKILGPRLDLFHFSELVGPGLPLWTPKGTLMRTLLDNFVWQLREKYGYQKVEIPHITKKDLFEKSGHWDKFKNELFKIVTREEHLFAMKPMNCPFHTQIYNSRPRSYRDLPQRYANTTMVYRDEQSGELSGLSRVRCITQDDAHVFCRLSQVKEEFLNVWDIIDKFYSSFGFTLQVRLSLRDPQQPDKYLGEAKNWEIAEETLRVLAKGRGVEFREALGEAAFYGPKVDFMAHDSLNREWQVATIQLDMNMPERFNLFCTNENGEEERIVMIHAAIMGAIERFLSILIEHYAGAFPTWLAPVQVAVLPVSDKVGEYAEKVYAEFKKNSIRAELDRSSKTLGAKIREWTLQKVPYLCIIGEREVASGDKMLVSVRTRSSADRGALSLYEFITELKKAIETKKAE